MSSPLILTLYVRVGCHLCEIMQRQLETLQQQHDFSLNIVDIDADAYLKLRYGERIPVLATGEQEICHYHLDEKVVLETLVK